MFPVCEGRSDSCLNVLSHGPVENFGRGIALRMVRASLFVNNPQLVTNIIEEIVGKLFSTIRYNFLRASVT